MNSREDPVEVEVIQAPPENKEPLIEDRVREERPVMASQEEPSVEFSSCPLTRQSSLTERKQALLQQARRYVDDTALLSVISQIFGKMIVSLLINCSLQNFYRLHTHTLLNLKQHRYQ